MDSAFFRGARFSDTARNKNHVLLSEFKKVTASPTGGNPLRQEKPRSTNPQHYKCFVTTVLDPVQDRVFACYYWIPVQDRE